jgi:hypothetical protein
MSFGGSGGYDVGRIIERGRQGMGRGECEGSVGEGRGRWGGIPGDVNEE